MLGRILEPSAEFSCPGIGLLHLCRTWSLGGNLHRSQRGEQREFLFASLRCLGQCLEYLQTFGEVTDRLGICGSRYCTLSRLPPVTDGVLGEACLRIVVGQTFDLLGQPGRID